MDKSLTILQLMRLVSPSLPVGAFSWSQGLESAVELSYVTDYPSSLQWIETVMSNNIAQLDLPVMARLYTAIEQGDCDSENYWSHFLVAARETRELQLEDKQVAMALHRLLKSVCPDALQGFATEKTWPGLFCRAAFFYGASLEETQQAFLWSWLENQVAAAGKLVPLGQTDMQKMISELIPLIPSQVSNSQAIEDEHIGYGLPGFIHASVQHETQYSRLFRS